MHVREGTMVMNRSGCARAKVRAGRRSGRGMRWSGAGAAVAAFALTLAACGGSSGPSSGTGASGADFLSAPLKIVFLWSIAGEDSASANYYNQGGVMAVDEINAAGGVGGQKIQTVRFESSPLDPTNVVTNFLSAVDAKPAFIIGLPAPDAEAASEDVTRAGIPTFSITQDQNLNYGAKAGSPWLFTTVTNDGLQAAVASRFVADNLKATRVGLLHTNESFGDTGSAIQSAYFKQQGIKIVADIPYAVDATDLTGPVLAVKGAQAVIDWGYPNPVAVQLNQFLQNGIHVPTITGGAAPYIVDGKLASAAAIKQLYSIDPCNPTPSTPRIASWIKSFEARYGQPPTASSAESYDAVYLAVAAIKAARSIDPDKVRAAIESVHYTNGICTNDYHADGAHELMHSVTVISWGTGVGKTEAVIQTPDQSAGTPNPVP
jgi:branched-chain amino acid transport system substrate-binding protein